MAAWARMLPLLALAVSAWASETAADCKGDACMATEDENSALLQSRARARLEVQVFNYTNCETGASVPCPGSGNMCAGDQCCPPTKESGQKTFPCPSAGNDFASCQNNTKISNCTKSAAMLEVQGFNSGDGCEKGAHVKCPGSGNMCAGDQCCPRTKESGEKTFPCPSASKDFAKCENNTKVSNCVKKAMLVEDSGSDSCEKGAHVKCPGSGNMCAGDQCCPRTKESGEKTFPCPSASKDFAKCENNTKVSNCVKK